MKDDPIIDEVRRAGEAYLAQFKFDLKAACADLQRRTEEAAKSGRRILAPPPRRPKALPTPKKRVG